jgi:hypothetical protein
VQTKPDINLPGWAGPFVGAAIGAFIGSILPGNPHAPPGTDWSQTKRILFASGIGFLAGCVLCVLWLVDFLRRSNTRHKSTKPENNTQQ